MRLCAGSTIRHRKNRVQELAFEVEAFLVHHQAATVAEHLQRVGRVGARIRIDDHAARLPARRSDAGLICAIGVSKRTVKEASREESKASRAMETDSS